MKTTKYIINIFFYILITFFAENSYTQTGWVSNNIGTRNYVAVNFIDENIGFIFAKDGVILKTTNAGISWQLTQHVFMFPIATGLAISENLLSVIVGNVSGGMIHMSYNGGANWISCLNSFIPIGNGSSSLRSVTFVNENTGYVCGNEYGWINGQFYVDGIIYKTTNSGANWFLSQRIGFDFYDIKFQNEEIGYVVLGEVVKTTDSGNYWEYVGAVFSQTFSLSTPFNDTLYMSSTNGNVHKSINGGVDWTTTNTGSTDSLLQIYFTNSLTGYSVGTLGTIVKTTTGGQNWDVQLSNTTQRLNSIYMIDSETGFAVGNNGVILKTTTGGVLTGFTNQSSETPEDFILYQNYPNPFNPMTKIDYKVSRTNFVELKVYNVLGDEITILVNERKLPGSYTVVFDGQNFPSGIYFYRLVIDGKVVAAKHMLLLK